MSDISNRLEWLADCHRIPVLTIQEWFNERAAIRQYEGGYSRADAERLALADVEAGLEGRHG